MGEAQLGAQGKGETSKGKWKGGMIKWAEN